MLSCSKVVSKLYFQVPSLLKSKASFSLSIAVWFKEKLLLSLAFLVEIIVLVVFSKLAFKVFVLSTSLNDIPPITVTVVVELSILETVEASIWGKSFVPTIVIVMVCVSEAIGLLSSLAFIVYVNVNVSPLAK